MIEVLIAVALGALFITAGAALITPALRSNKQEVSIQMQSSVANELAGNIRSWAASNWNKVLGLSTGTYNYYLITTSSPFVATTGNENVSLGSSTFVRYFGLNDVYRDSGGNITSTAGSCVGSSPCYDPSTKMVTLIYGPQGSATTSFTFYVTRNGANFTAQTDWSGGFGQNNPQTIVTSTFSTSSNITYSTAGQLTLTSSGGACLQ